MATPTPTLAGLDAAQLKTIRSRPTVHDHVFTQLRETLMAGRFDPGQVLTIPQLSASFGVSHMPVREALRQLAAENALEPMTNGSLRVPVVSRSRLDDLMEARLAIEPLAAARAAGRADAPLLEAVEAAVDAHRSVTPKEGVETLLKLNRDVHFLIYRAAGSAVLNDLIEALWLRFGPYLRMLSQAIGPRLEEAAFKNGADHHLACLVALREGKAEGARQAIAADITATHTMLRPFVDGAD